jgi:hypothetical protein
MSLSGVNSVGAACFPKAESLLERFETVGLTTSVTLGCEVLASLREAVNRHMLTSFALLGYTHGCHPQRHKR